MLTAPAPAPVPSQSDSENSENDNDNDNDEMIFFQILGVAWPILAACLFIMYCVSLAIYRLYLSPLAKFPGPKLAAISLWYEFYYDVIKTGEYVWEIEKMHKEYGQPALTPRDALKERSYIDTTVLTPS